MVAVVGLQIVEKTVDLCTDKAVVHVDHDVGGIARTDDRLEVREELGNGRGLILTPLDRHAEAVSHQLVTLENGVVDRIGRGRVGTFDELVIVVRRAGSGQGRLHVRVVLDAQGFTLERNTVPFVVTAAGRLLGRSGTGVLAATTGSKDTGTHDKSEQEAEQSDCFFHVVPFLLCKFTPQRPPRTATAGEYVPFDYCAPAEPKFDLMVSHLFFLALIWAVQAVLKFLPLSM